MKKVKVVLHNYQKRMSRNAKKYINRWENLFIDGATGIGKSYIIADIVKYILRKFEGSKILILSPSNHINNNTRKVLIDSGVPIEEITQYFNRQQNVHLFTYCWLYQNAEKKKLLNYYSHVIFDEAHRLGAQIWFEKGIQNTVNGETCKIGFSASWFRKTKNINLLEFFDHNMADQMTLLDAIEAGILPQAKYVYSILDIKSTIINLKDEIKKKLRDKPEELNNMLTSLDARSIKSYSIKKIIKKHYKSNKYKKIVAFCSEINHIPEIEELLNEIFSKFSKVKFYKVHSDLSSKKCQETIDYLTKLKSKNGETHILLCVNMLNEGIHIKGISSVMMFRKTESSIVYFHQIGRTLETNGCKRPMIFDCVLNYRNINFKTDRRNIKKKLGFDEEPQKREEQYIPKLIEIFDEIKEVTTILDDIEDRLKITYTINDAIRHAKSKGGEFLG